MLITTGCYPQNKYSEGISDANGKHLISYSGAGQEMIVELE